MIVPIAVTIVLIKSTPGPYIITNEITPATNGIIIANHFLVVLNTAANELLYI